jgi:hypothetical protein
LNANFLDIFYDQEKVDYLCTQPLAVHSPDEVILNNFSEQKYSLYSCTTLGFMYFKSEKASLAICQGFSGNLLSPFSLLYPIPAQPDF